MSTALPRRAPAFLAFAAACALLAGCSRQPRSQEPVVTVQVAPAKRTTIERIVQAEAVLYPIKESAITPKISAPVKTFLVQRGAKVHRGRLLAILENRDLQASALENKGAYEQAQAAYQTAVKANLPEEWQKAELDKKAAKESLDAARKIYVSRQNLYQQGALPRKDLDQAQVAYVQARNQYELAQRHLQALQAGGKQQEMKAARGQLESAKGKFESSLAQLNYTEIRSPIDGVITDRPLYPGEMASPGTPLITVMDLTQVIARAHIPQDETAQLKIGDPATIAAPGANQSVPAKVTVVSPALDPSSTTVEIWVQAGNPGAKLRPGSNVQVEMVAGKVPNAIVVPASALLKNAEGATSVMVVGADSRAHQHAVKVGVQQGDQVQIAGGLQPGEEVITQGAYGLPDNTRVQVESEAPKTSSGGGARRPASQD